MPRAWENNPNGICEDAPACGCCGPQGDGVIEPSDPGDFDIDDGYHSDYYGDDEYESDRRADERDDFQKDLDYHASESPDHYWFMD